MSNVANDNFHILDVRLPFFTKLKLQIKENEMNCFNLTELTQPVSANLLKHHSMC